MHLIQNAFVKWMGAPALMAAMLSLLVAGCASPSTPPDQLPPSQTALLPPALSSDQMAKLCQEAPDTCHRVQTAQPLTLVDVKVMAKIGFSSDVIITQVRNSRTVYHLTANAIIDLKNSGVSEQVIDFLISTPSSVAGSTPVPSQRRNPPQCKRRPRRRLSRPHPRLPAGLCVGGWRLGMERRMGLGGWTLVLFRRIRMHCGFMAAGHADGAAFIVNGDVGVRSVRTALAANYLLETRRVPHFFDVFASGGYY